MTRYELRLYVSGKNPQSELAIENLIRTCDSELKGRYDVEIVEVEADGPPQQGGAVITPGIVEGLPPALRRHVMVLRDRANVLCGVELAEHDDGASTSDRLDAARVPGATGADARQPGERSASCSDCARQRPSVLVIDGDAPGASPALLAEKSPEFDVVQVESMSSAERWLSSHTCEAVVVDVDLPGALSEGALSKLRRAREELPVLAVSRSGDAQREAALRTGADEFFFEHELKGHLLSFCVSLAAERTRAREEVKNLQMQILNYERMASLGTIAASVAHEINNPLGAVLANVELAIRRGSAAGGELDDARTATLRIRQIVRELSLFSRSDEEPRPIDVHHVLDSVIRMASSETRYRSTVVTDYRFVGAVKASETRLSQVFLNLLVNAAQSIPEGNPVENRIRVATRNADGGGLVVCFEDTGCGMTEDVQRSLFQPFFTTKGRGLGTGLGLFITRRIVTSFDGEIAVESVLGKGSRFTIAFPAKMSAEALESRRVPKTRPVSGRRCRIIVIDDDPHVGSSIKWILDQHDVTCVGGATEAMRLFARGEAYDLVLCDLLMPSVSGMDLYRAVAAEDAELAARFVFVTAGASTPSAREFLSQVTNPRVEKPFDVHELGALVEELVRQGRGRAPSKGARSA